MPAGRPWTQSVTDTVVGLWPGLPPHPVAGCSILG